MATLDFPSTGLVANTTTYTANGKTWLWDGTTWLSYNTFAGTISVSNGGTGATSLTANSVLLGNGTSAIQTVAPGTNGNVLTSNGTTWTSSTPATGVSTGKAIAMAMIFGG